MNPEFTPSTAPQAPIPSHPTQAGFTYGMPPPAVPPYTYGVPPVFSPPYAYGNPGHMGYAGAPLNPPAPDPTAKARRGERLRDDAFDYVEKDLTLSIELIERLPKFVRDWTPEHVQDWLQEIFAGTKGLPNYVKGFSDLGVRGIDLLAAEDEDLATFGITVPLHVTRARTCINQLRNDQKNKESTAALEKNEKRFIDLKEKFEKQNLRVPKYLLPRKIELWKTLDVFTFLMYQVDETEEDLSKFLKPFALANVNGTRLNELRRLDKWEEIEGLDVSDREIKVLKSLLLTFERKEEDKFKRLQEVKKRKQKAGLITIQEEALRKKELIDQGASGRVYFGTYERKKVSIKVMKRQKVIPEPGETEETTAAKELKQQEIQMADLMHEAKMTHEAYKACSTGVVKFFGACLTSVEPMLVLQYLSNKSVEHEMHAADRDNEESIFHISNEQNLRDEGNGVKNPVMLQVVRIARDVASALSKLHDAGIVHLDIAARNILLDGTKRPKVGDFGNAARESDLTELYRLQKRVLDEGSRMCKDDDELQVDRDIAFDSFKSERLLLDENTLRIYDMPARERYVRHMPVWVIDCEETHNPLLDSHTDIYSFGCFIYEMATRKVPHFEIHMNSPQEVIDKKLAGNGNPIIPASVDSRLARLMASCWDEYDDQPTMASLAKDLSELHTSMSTESTPLDQGYDKFKNMVLQSNQYGPHSVAPRRTSFGGKREIDDDMIRFDFENSHLIIDPDDPILEYEGVGKKKAGLEDTLLCALRYRDDVVLVAHLQCICIENRDVQIDMLCLCMDYLAILADDEHSSTDEDGKWQILCAAVSSVLNTALVVIGGPSKRTEHQLVLDPIHQSELLKHGLPAIAGLLGRKSLDDEFDDGVSDENSNSLVSSLCDLVCQTLEHFHGDSEIAEAAASVIERLVELSPLAMRQLHNKSVIVKLLDVVRENMESHNTVLHCIKALGSFPLRILLEPQPVKAVSRERAVTARNAVLKSKESVATLERNWSLVLQTIVEVMHRCTQRIKEVSASSFVATELLALLEACCLMLFRSCEACSFSELDIIERFFYSADSSTIGAVIAALQVAPDHFRIQEGAIGALGHLLSTGHMEFTDANKLHVEMVGAASAGPFELVPRRTSAEERISAFLAVDPSLKLLLSAMDKFRVNDKIATGIVTTTTTSGRKYNSTATMSKYAPLSQTMTKTTTALTVSSVHERGQREGELMFEAMEFDKDGERKTAASIQSNVAIVIGYACIHHKDVQQNLVRSRYNDMILTSFQNFSNDKCLIEYGCRAFYWTCRRNSMHQLMLMERKIFRQLVEILNKFNDEWTVLNAVICTILGLLEPPDDAFIQQPFPGEDLDIKEIKKTRPVPPQNCTGRKVVEELLKCRNGTESIFTFIMLRAFEFISQEDTEQLTANALRLVTSIMYWSPGKVEEWANEGVLNFKSNSESMASILLKVLVFRLGKEQGMVEAQKSKRHKIMNEISANTATAITTTAKSSSAPAQLNSDNSRTTTDQKDLQSAVDLKMKKAHALMMEAFEKQNDAKNTACILTLMFVSLEISIPLVFFVTIIMNWHDGAPDVLAAGLANVVQLYHSIIMDAEKKNNVRYPIGCMLPYASEEKLQNMRGFMFSLGFIKHCMFAMEKQLDHPVLIRYSIWVLLLLISEPKSVDDGFSPDNPCSDICLSGAPEWIVEVMKRYEDFYSLQTLGAMFLVRAEEQGAFINRSFETLEDMRECAVRACNRCLTDFKSFAEEGEDTYLIGQPLLIFGQLQTHADRLLRAIDKHLSPASTVGLGQGYSSGLISHFSFGKGSTSEYVKAPLKITVTSAETEENHKSQRYIAYTLLVDWSEDLKWSVSYRHSQFRELWAVLEDEFNHLEALNTEQLRKLTAFQSLWKFSPDLLEERKMRLQSFLDNLLKTQAKLFSPNLLQFLKCEENVSAEKLILPTRLQNVIPTDRMFPINDIVCDEILGLVIVGSGIVKTGLLDRAQSKVRGSITIFSCAEPETLSRVSQLEFNSGVVKLAWDSRRRCLCIGYSSGAISLHYLAPNNVLQYCSEIDVHRSDLCHLSYSYSRDSLLSVSTAGMLTAYDMKDGLFTAQTSCKGLEFTSATFDAVENVLFCGTATNSVVAYNLNDNPPGRTGPTITLDCPTPAPITSIDYVESRKLLYVAFKHRIYIYRVSGSPKDRSLSIKIWTPCSVLNLRADVTITAARSINEGNFIFVSCLNGRIALFDMRNDNIEASKGVDDAPTTVRGAVLPWNEVINCDCSTICDWLRAAGKNSSSASNRLELLRLVMNAVSVTSDEFADRLLLNAKPKGTVFFSWKLSIGSVQNKAAPFARCVSYLDNPRVLVIGCGDGHMHSFGINRFFPPFSSVDAQQLTSHLSAFPRTTDTLGMIKGSVKTSKAKKHQLPS